MSGRGLPCSAVRESSGAAIAKHAARGARVPCVDRDSTKAAGRLRRTREKCRVRMRRGVAGLKDQRRLPATHSDCATPS